MNKLIDKVKLTNYDTLFGGMKSLVEDVNIELLIPSEDNIYSMDNIEDLAEDIKLNGLLQNLLVKRDNEINSFIVIAGHRRLAAIKLLNEKERTYTTVPAIILDENESEDLTKLKLHTTNLLSRQLNEYEKLEGIDTLSIIYKKIAQNTPTNLEVINKISEVVGLKQTQIKKYLYVKQNASRELLNEMKNGKMSLSAIYSILTGKEKKEVTIYTKTEKAFRILDDLELNSSEAKRVNDIKLELLQIIKNNE